MGVADAGGAFGGGAPGGGAPCASNAETDKITLNNVANATRREVFMVLRIILKSGLNSEPVRQPQNLLALFHNPAGRGKLREVRAQAQGQVRAITRSSDSNHCWGRAFSAMLKSSGWSGFPRVKPNGSYVGEATRPGQHGEFHRNAYAWALAWFSYNEPRESWPSG